MITTASSRGLVDRLRAICLALPETTEKMAWGEPKSDPKRFFVPPYVGPRGWIGVRIDRRPNWRLVTTLVHDAYAQVAPQPPPRPRRRTRS